MGVARRSSTSTRLRRFGLVASVRSATAMPCASRADAPMRMRRCTMRTTTPAVARLLALAVGLPVLAVAPTRADVAATGSFTISIDPDLDVNGSLDFDPGSTEVLGQPLDLKALVGRMSLEGDATDFDPSARSASFDVTLATSSP